jgi:hypothetical protein
MPLCIKHLGKASGQSNGAKEKRRMVAHPALIFRLSGLA